MPVLDWTRVDAGLFHAFHVVSPGGKGSKRELRAFVTKTADLIQQGVHVLVIDLFPPTRRDPEGPHKEIWDEFEDKDFTLPADEPLILASDSTGPVKTAYVESVGVGDVLPAMLAFSSRNSTSQSPWRPPTRQPGRSSPPHSRGCWVRRRCRIRAKNE
jgi:hypothetical protein